MNHKVVFCFLGLWGLAVAASVPDDAAIYGATLSSSDSFADVVRKFFPSLVHTAGAQGGSTTDRMNRVNLAFIPLARAQVTLRAINGENYDTQRALADIEGTERVLVRVSKLLKDLEDLANELPADWRYRPTLDSDEVKEISGIGLETARTIAENSDSKVDLKNVVDTGSGIISAFDLIKNIGLFISPKHYDE